MKMSASANCCGEFSPITSRSSDEEVWILTQTAEHYQMRSPLVLFAGVICLGSGTCFQPWDNETSWCYACRGTGCCQH
jgi:hypothetical protein